ncbi:uncharacterized protein CANTADRAFT_38014, partial [Suhomyces tanzawaensis NRRL Y-17324]
PAYEDVPMWSILPSYHLFQSTFSKNILPGTEDRPPPTYFTTPDCQPSSNEYFPQVPNDDVDSPTRWEDTILANSYRMKKLTGFDHLHISIHLTAAPCKLGVPPQLLNHDRFEFQQGDPVQGYITVRNTAPFPLPFDMFSVVFEGKISVMPESSEKKEPLVFNKFLNMFDYNASWTPVNFDDHDDVMFDPIDNTRNRFPMEKFFEPNVTYKKFFNFKIPDRLLDCSCETHNFQRHIQIMPTIGLDKDQFLKDIRKFRERNKRPELVRKKSNINEVLDRRIKDFSFSDTSISYSVEARVIGKDSEYTKVLGKPKPQGEKEEFLIVSEASCFIRVVPKETLLYEFDTEVLDRQSQSVYNNLVRIVRQKIDLGKQLLQEKEIENSETTHELGRTSSVSKIKQTGQQNGVNGVHKTKYEVFVPLKKKTLTAPPKIVAVLGMATAKTEYKVQYCPPHLFKSILLHSPREEISTLVQIPIDLTLQFSSEASTKSMKPPEIKSIGAELVVFTHRSKKYAIPIEVTHDLLFKNNGEENDNFEGIVIKPFKQYLHELSELMEKFNSGVLDVDRQLVMDIKCLAYMQTKYNKLKIENVKLNQFSTTWKTGSLATTLTKKFMISLDLKAVLSRELTENLVSEAHALVPSFQSCIIGRSYYIVVTLRLQNGESVSLKVPLKILR